MRRWPASAVLAVALLSLGLPTVAPAQPLFGPTQDPLAGSRVFGSKGCARCHAVKGVGGGIGPDLGRIARPRSFYDLAAAMWNHLPRMSDRMRQLGIPRPALDRTEAGDLIAFLFTLDYFDTPGDAAAGQRLFAAKRCIVCHQVGGVGGVLGPNLDLLGQYGSPIFVAAAMWNHGPAMSEAMRARGIARPAFEGSELRDLIAYLRTAAPVTGQEPLHLLPGRADQGRRLFVDKRCIACHGAGGQGGGTAPDLAERGRQRSLLDFAAAMWNKAPAMIEAMKARGVPLPELRAEEMADLVAYLYAVRYFAEPGDPRRGRERAADRGCLDCHSVLGTGGRKAGDLAQATSGESPAGIVAALWNHSRLPEQRKGAWPEFRPEEMADLVAFLQAVRRVR
jgi:mono/diheme cytochrome c family protein